MAFNFKSFNQLVTDQVNAVMAKSNKLIDFTIGSILRSWIESNSFLTMWLQGLIINILTIIRASTIPDNDEADLDSWFSDFSYTRFQGSPSTGNLVFSRNTPDSLAYVTVGTRVETAVNSIPFIVTLDDDNINYVPEMNAYKLDVGTKSINVPAQCLTNGTVGNVSANQINLINSPIVGVDSVTNPFAFVNGKDKDNNSQARKKFALYLLSLAKANKGTIEYALISNPNIKSYSLIENQDFIGNKTPGLFIAVIDDGSGNPPSSLIQNVMQTLNAVRGFTIRYAVYPPQVIQINISTTITINPDFDTQLVLSAVKNALSLYLTNLNIGEKVIYTKIYGVIYSASAGVVNVNSLFVNGGTVDINFNFNQKAEPNIINVIN